MHSRNGQMTPDEFEARLRDAVTEHVAQMLAHAELCGRKQAAYADMADAVVLMNRLDGYRDFIRLRAVAEAGCYRLQWSGNTCLEAGKWIMSSACPACTAQREIEALIGGE